ncbi:MAG: DUF2922 domain-containing protein [Solibacillus sp.]
MAQVLQMTFTNEENHTLTINVNDPKDNMVVAEVSAVMDTIIASGVFVKDGFVFNRKKSARLVDRVVSDFELN